MRISAHNSMKSVHSERQNIL